ncbi:Beige/BEACH domain, partial [Striga asiatica]
GATPTLLFLPSSLSPTHSPSLKSFPSATTISSALALPKTTTPSSPVIMTGSSSSAGSCTRDPALLSPPSSTASSGPCAGHPTIHDGLEQVRQLHRHCEGPELPAFVHQLTEFPAPVSTMNANDLLGDVVLAGDVMLVVWSINGNCLDLSSLTFLHQLTKFPAPISTMYANDLTGDVVTTADVMLVVWSINGNFPTALITNFLGTFF